MARYTAPWRSSISMRPRQRVMPTPLSSRHSAISETLAQMLANLLRFAKSDWSEGCAARADKLKSMISIFEGVLREFEQGYEFWDAGSDGFRAHVLYSLNGAKTGIDLFVQKHPIFDDSSTCGQSHGLH